jgi:hypothetical protein
MSIGGKELFVDAVLFPFTDPITPEKLKEGIVAELHRRRIDVGAYPRRRTMVPPIVHVYLSTEDFLRLIGRFRDLNAVLTSATTAWAVQQGYAFEGGIRVHLYATAKVIRGKARFRSFWMASDGRTVPTWDTPMDLGSTTARPAVADSTVTGPAAVRTPAAAPADADTPTIPTRAAPVISTTTVRQGSVQPSPSGLVTVDDVRSMGIVALVHAIGDVDAPALTSTAVDLLRQALGRTRTKRAVRTRSDAETAVAEILTAVDSGVRRSLQASGSVYGGVAVAGLVVVSGKHHAFRVGPVGVVGRPGEGDDRAIRQIFAKPDGPRKAESRAPLGNLDGPLQVTLVPLLLGERRRWMALTNYDPGDLTGVGLLAQATSGAPDWVELAARLEGAASDPAAGAATTVFVRHAPSDPA